METQSHEEMHEATLIEKHKHRVSIKLTNGVEVATYTVEAGSKSHAALIVGIDLLASLLEKNYTPEQMTIAMHNILDHFVVDVELIG